MISNKIYIFIKNISLKKKSILNQNFFPFLFVLFSFWLVEQIYRYITAFSLNFYDHKNILRQFSSINFHHNNIKKLIHPRKIKTKLIFYCSLKNLKEKLFFWKKLFVKFFSLFVRENAATSFKLTSHFGQKYFRKIILCFFLSFWSYFSL